VVRQPWCAPPGRTLPQASAERTGVEAVRSITSEQLLAGRRLLLIRHGKDEYRLQITASGKLILTK
jgi:hemin uptake protein HemP